MEEATNFWYLHAIPANIPYVNLLFLNTGQAIIAIFLASDFLKRDKKLDTSEVFYVRSLSNAEYVIGKIWGNLRVFLILNLIILAISVTLTLISPRASIDWAAYLIYFFLISIPTLIYIIGLSVFLMLLLKNQALTFILLLGYIGVTLFYINDKYYYLFDYMTYYLPLVKSTVVGFTNGEAILTHRSIYFFAGLAFIFLTIALFRRLPNSSRSIYPWLALSVILLLLSGGAAYKHVHSFVDEREARILYTGVNNRYVHTPKLLVEEYAISAEQRLQSFSAEIKMTGTALQAASVFTFCLNPGLKIKEVKRDNDRILAFERDRQIVRIDFGTSIGKGDTVSLTMKYEGRIDPSFCYLDIPPEILQKANDHEMLNCDKQYSFQTADYLLFTPEAYWYPRPGTAYSSESADWQQTYFSRFQLNVKPLPGLIPISQGEITDNGDGSYSFRPEYPVQAIALIIGKYKQQSVEKEGILYSIRYLEGHDYYSATFTSIQDTIPSLIRNFKENMERQYKLNYPFKRFSIVEVPAQFYSYPHTWSQAQETLQPEMTLFIEKGWKYREMNVENRKKNKAKWAKRNGEELNEEEVQIRTFNDLFNLFSNPDGEHNFSSGNRGEWNVHIQANPYFLFPQLYNFRYNIFSPDWPVANRIVELYLQDKAGNPDWEREINGISNNEKANLLLEKQSLKELTADVEHRDLSDLIVNLKAHWLFAPAEINTGIQAFRDSVYSLLERNTFRNIQFENLLDTLGRISQTDIKSTIREWESPTPLPYYSIGAPEIIKVVNKGKEAYILKIIVGNDSGRDGVIQVNIRADNYPPFDPKSNRKISMKAHQSKQLTSIWEEEPRSVTINTLISSNLPNTVTQSPGIFKREDRAIVEKEGDFTVSGVHSNVSGEVIVDNEDSLFFLSKAPVTGLLPKWLDKTEDTSFKYSGLSMWRPPIQWKATTNPGYYGNYIRSAYVVKSGKGNQTATWKVPVPSPGKYEVYYHLFKGNNANGNNAPGAEYHFRIQQDKETEDAYLNLSKANNGWEQLGVYYVGSDTISIVLSNESKERIVTADAVKIVKR
jgi:ABC-type transport system involved in multi-copper enzyme maturation permease subunit/uncharacterized membrane protein YgdD (TMEM256/DUF423 family)